MSESALSSNWYDDEAVLEAEIRRTISTHGAPSIPGYDEIREHARGGQGVVYVATQRSTRRRVAIKVLLHGDLASGAARRRFEREIELVARLRHPNVVSVYDSGVTADGRAFLVMEYVEGSVLGEQGFAGVGSRDEARAALAAFAKVCDAVGYAHQRGVIHRDLKPRNIRLDLTGEPRVLDFGLAKPVGERDGRATLSVSGQFMGSLPWASPEQAAGDPEAVDVRSDVYSLGVILYQWLTGSMPYDLGTSLADAVAAITDTEPPTPSRLKQGVDEDLATITLKCLAKDPARRYQSAAELAADCRRYLAGEPIAARRDSAWYALSKAVRRHRITTIASVIVVAAALAALAVSTSALREARAQRDRATKKTEVARAVSKFVEDMLGAADPGKQGKDIRIVDVLGPASGLADQTLRDQPEARVMVRSVLSSAYRNLQLFQEADEQARLGLEVAERDLSGRGIETARLRTTHAAVLVDLGERERGLEQARAALDLARAEEGPDSPAALEAAMTAAYALDQLQRLDEAVALKRENLDRATRVLGPEAQDTLGAAGNLAHTLYLMGRLDEAIPLLEQTIERSRRALGPDNIATLAPISTLASCYSAKGQRDKAEPLLKDAWQRLSRTYGPESASTLIYANNYAILLHNTGRSAEARPIAEQCLAGLTSIYGPEHARVMSVMSTLGSIEGRLGNNDKQLDWQSKALALADKNLGRTHRTTVYIRNNYASTLGSLHRFDEAVAEYRACVADADAAFPPTDSMPWAVRFNLAKNLRGLGRDDEALDALRVAAPKLLETLGPKSEWTTDASDALLELLDKQGLAAEAAAWRERLAGAAK